MKRLLIAAILASVSLPAAAQTTAESYRSITGQVRDGLGVTIVAPVRSNSTTINGSVAVANTFQSALTASTARKGCAIVNNHASATLMVFLGAPGSASAANSIPVAAGGSFNCGSFQGLVLTDQISVTSTTAGATYVVVSQ